MGERRASVDGVAQGTKSYYRADQIVVGLRYESLVIACLDEHLSVKAQRVDSDDRLGLCLIELDAASARAELDEDWVRSEIERSATAGYESSDLDLVVRRLRSLFAAQYGGWMPTLGKNRLMGPVHGSYVIDGGGNGEPPTLVSGQYVIDGGGTGAPVSVPVSDSTARSVALRKDEPGRGARVGIVDTQVGAHPWLAGAYLASASDMLPAHPAQPLPWTAGHATFVAGLVLCQAPGAVVDLHHGLLQNAEQDSWTVAKAIASLAGSDVQIVNLSLGCYTDDGEPPLVLAAALDSLGPETVVVAAAGNNGGSPNAKSPVWPAAFESVIAVAALDGDGLAAFSPDMPWLNAVAQGVDVVSTYLTGPVDGVGPGDNGGFARWSGTSFAAATVSGAIAARIVPGRRTAQHAWRTLQADNPKDDKGRTIVPSSFPADWPVAP